MVSAAEYKKTLTAYITIAKMNGYCGSMSEKERIFNHCESTNGLYFKRILATAFSVNAEMRKMYGFTIIKK